MNETTKGVAGLILTVLLFASAVVSVRIAYGANDTPYTVVVGFDRAGQGLILGSDVTLRGVPIGEVGAIDLVDGRVDIRLDIGGDRQVPRSATAVIRPKTLFGEKEIALDYDPRSGGPFFADGERFPDGAGRAGTEVEGLVDSSTILLERIDEEQLAIIIAELSDATEGQGDNIREQFNSGLRLSTLFADTLDAQLVALEGTAELSENLANAGDDLNAVSVQLNRGLPIINAGFADYQRFLATVPPFARELSELLSISRPNIHKMLEEGDNISRVLLARQPELEETLEGLAQYFGVFATGVGNEKFEDGTRFVYFVAFAAQQDVNDLVCSLLGASPIPDFKELVTDLQGGDIDCSGLEADSASTAAAGSAPLPEPGQRLLDRVGIDIATADQPVVSDVNSLVGAWAGADDE